MNTIQQANKDDALEAPVVVKQKGEHMHALVFHGPNAMSWDEVPKPVVLTDTDAIIRVEATTICGSDLHILKGDVPETTAGRILGHEAVGTVEAIGASVKTLKIGDRVLVSCITSCGSCRFCRQARYGQCAGGGGWILGHIIDGTRLSMCAYHSLTTQPTRSLPGRRMRKYSCWPISCPQGMRWEC